MTSILIVEDDVLANEYLEFTLQQVGYEVVSATSADEAAALLEGRDDVQLIVTDINLPGTMNGLKLAAAVKARRPAMNIIIVTGVPLQRLRAAVAAPHSTSAGSHPCLRSTTEPLTRTLLARTFRSPIFVPLERELGARAERYERRNAGG
jgi:CheY-like chemotaxis protein